MAVSLGPGGLSGDRGGVLVSTGDMTTLGHSGNVSTDVDIPLPTGYDHFRVFLGLKQLAEVRIEQLCGFK